MDNKKKYNIGLDIGTTSVGWAVVESDNQKIMRKGNKTLWGVRLFDEAVKAESRRNFRSARRRYDRRRERIKLLQEEFKSEMNRVDPNFFTKLKESKYVEEDTINKTIILNQKEKDEVNSYLKKYKTIYHLRKELMDSKERKDIRLVYLAIHHIIKYRGNFNYNIKNFNVSNLNIEEQLKNTFNIYFSYINPEYDNFEDILDLKELSSALLLQSKMDAKVEAKNLLISYNIFDNKFITAFIKMIFGNKFNISDLLLIDTDKKLEINFDGTDLDDKYSDIEELCGEKIEVLESMKGLYDTLFLKEDLKFLKLILHSDKKTYKKFFKGQCIYKEYISNKKTYEEFISDIDKAISNIEITDYNLSNKYLTLIKEKMDNGKFIPRITSTENGKYPYQLNEDELKKIIENQGKYYPFLLNKTDDGIYKIVKLLEFRIPYFVGPLVSSEQSKFAWMERNIKNEKITPFNFDKIVNKELTAENFIKRMISHCTYLLEEDVLPNNSILYNNFKVLNELKQIRINGEKLDLNFQHKIIDELFKTAKGKISDKKFKDYLLSNNEYPMHGTELNITGYSSDGAFANNMQSYIDFFGENGILKNTNYDEKDAENIIEWITIFDDKDILENKVKSNYPNLNQQQIKMILTKKYKGWGSLSAKLLNTKYYIEKDSGLKKSIIELMYETEDNFMQIINKDEYGFQNMINELNNKEHNIEKLNYSVVEPLATSPANKRGIYQALKVVDELVKYIGYDPENIMIEMARSDDKKERKDNRKKYIENLYKKSKSQIENYNKLLKELNKEEIDSQKMFLYFIQEGKCLYSGKPLNIEDLKEYEIDHIIPRTLIKDDSIDNKALVYRECNQNKAASYVLPKGYRDKNITWWKHLKSINLMSAKKFHNLIRKEYKDEDIEGFINRQLVETRQITKHVANILSSYYKNTKIIYLKAKLSHDYRDRYELFKFREINDYHHAHDAYLTAVLGEYKEKYLRKNVNFQVVKELNKSLIISGKKDKLKYGYVINSLDETAYDLINELSNKYIDEETGEVLFNADEFNKRIEDTLYRNDILVSRKPEIRTGKLFKETLYKKGVGNIEIKKNMPTKSYGGYLNIVTSYLVLIKFNEKKRIVGIPMQNSSILKNNEEKLIAYLKEYLKINNLEILKNNIPFDSLIIFKNQPTYIKGYSCQKKSCEISNALQLKIKKEEMQKWKKALNRLFNDKKNYLEYPDLEYQRNLISIIEYLFKIKESYPLFKKAIITIENKININRFDIPDLEEIATELFKIYQCNSINANLKKYGLGDRIGRLSGISIAAGTIINTSYTGIKGNNYEF